MRFAICDWSEGLLPPLGNKEHHGPRSIWISPPHFVHNTTLQRSTSAPSRSPTPYTPPIGCTRVPHRPKKRQSVSAYIFTGFSGFITVRKNVRSRQSGVQNVRNWRIHKSGLEVPVLSGLLVIGSYAPTLKRSTSAPSRSTSAPSRSRL